MTGAILAFALLVLLLGWTGVLPRALTYSVIGIGLAGILLAHSLLPDGHPLREATGGTALPWLLLSGTVLVLWGYGWILSWIRHRNQASAPEADTDASLERYARHIVLREIGGPGQKRLSEARVLVVGAGGLGSPALLYLAGAGVGTLGVIDDDVVSLSNLQRQIIHRDNMAGEAKVFSARGVLRGLNPTVDVRPYNRALTEEIAEDLIADYDLVLDGSDNHATRALVNRACVATGTPLIWGAIGQWDGQISLFDPARDGPCLACVFPEEPAEGLAPSCAEGGVAGPLPGVIGALMALEAVKLIAGAGAPLRGRMLILDGLGAESRTIRLTRDPDCPVCGV